MPSRTQINVVLTPDLRRFVQTEVSSGRYPSAGKMIAEGLRLLKKRERQSADVRRVRKKIATGLRQLDRGDVVDGEEFFQQLFRGREGRRSKAG